MPFLKLDFRSCEVNPADPYDASKPASKGVRDLIVEMTNMPPSTEYYLGDVEIDRKTLHTSIGFRFNIVQFTTKSALVKGVTLDPVAPEPHELDPKGKIWIKSGDTAGLRYVVTDMATPTVKHHVSIRFEKKS